jgi:hypothetical protein
MGMGMRTEEGGEGTRMGRAREGAYRPAAAISEAQAGVSLSGRGFSRGRSGTWGWGSYRFLVNSEVGGSELESTGGEPGRGGRGIGSPFPGPNTRTKQTVEFGVRFQFRDSGSN